MSSDDCSEPEVHSSHDEMEGDARVEEGVHSSEDAPEDRDPELGSSDEEDQEEDGEQVGLYSATEINEQVFDELHLQDELSALIQDTWGAYLRTADSREMAGEAIYAALFDSAPSLQSLFKTPRAVMAMRFMNGLNQIVSQLAEPTALKTTVETLAFQHLDLEVTVPRITIFADAICDLLMVELGDQMTPAALAGWRTVLNYVGGSFIFVRVKYTDRLITLASSWATANGRAVAGPDDEVEGEDKVDDGSRGSSTEASRVDEEKMDSHKKKGLGWGLLGSKSKGNQDEVVHKAGSGDNSGVEDTFRNTSVPTTFNEMFAFNAAVMGFGNNRWMQEVLDSFDAIVANVSNSYRLQEECDILSLRISKHRGPINLEEYRAVMLASLRSLVPKDWGPDHEVAWNWLWENVQRMLRTMLGKPANMQRQLEKLWDSLEDGSLVTLRVQVYSKFFKLAPRGEDYFKQSITRLQFIVDRVVSMTLEMYKEPKQMATDISALGLRHVGYGIPTDLFGPFVTSCVQVVRDMTDDDEAEEAFRWSLSLISRILVRVITEGSTLVMRAINVNSAKQVCRALHCAPRGKRAGWMLRIQVGTQAISPLLWSIETGSLEAAEAMLRDLLTIRADRDHYYYGMDEMFERHGDIVRRLCVEAPSLLPILLDGLIWRSRVTENGTRRVNYYVKHLIVDANGDFSQALEWITDHGNPGLVCHPVVTVVTDFVWSQVAFRTILLNKVWDLVSLMIFVVGTSGGKHMIISDNDEVERIIVVVCRAIVYSLRLPQLLYHHVKSSCRSYHEKDVYHLFGLPLPAYLDNVQEWGNLSICVLLVVMLALDPILHCLPDADVELFEERCASSSSVLPAFSVLASLGTIAYFTLIVELSVFSTTVSAYVLVGFHVLGELLLFLLGFGFLALAFASATSALDHDNQDFAGIPSAAATLVKITMAMYPGSRFSMLSEDPALFATVILYVLACVIFLLNMLVAQLNSSYSNVYGDMVGFARLKRGRILSETMPLVPEHRWRRFLDSLGLDHRIEFGEGDVGLAGGIQLREPANAHITTEEMIRRFGGSTSPKAQWPKDDLKHSDEDSRFDRLEKMIKKSFKRLAGKSGGGAGGSSSWMSGGSSLSSSMASGSGMSQGSNE